MLWGVQKKKIGNSISKEIKSNHRGENENDVHVSANKRTPPHDMEYLVIFKKTLNKATVLENDTNSGKPFGMEELF